VALEEEVRSRLRAAQARQVMVNPAIAEDVQSSA